MDSLLNKRTEFLYIIQSEEPDIVCLTEVLPKNFTFSVDNVELSLDGYDCFSNIDRTNADRGVVIYVKTCFSAQNVIFAQDDSVKDNVWVEIKLQQGDCLLIGCIYRSPNSTKEHNTRLS